MGTSNITGVDQTFSGAPQINADIFSSINEVESSYSGIASDSIAWLKNNVKTLFQQKTSLIENSKSKFQENLNKSFLSSRIDTRSIGRMFMYIYDPKLKKKLPYYDTVPLLILVDFVKGGFRGLNLHYVPPYARKKILAALIKNMNNKGITEKARINISYNILKRSARFDVIKPCFKRYLFYHVKSTFMYIDPTEWEKAVLLPTERFQKKSKGEIYAEFTKQNLKAGLNKAKIHEEQEEE